MNKIYILITLLVIINSCSPQQPVELEVIPLSLKRQAYNGDELKIDGYYFHVWESDMAQFSIFVIYKNGVVIFANNSPDTGFEEMEDSFSDGTFYDYKKEKRTDWGVFQISSNTIKLEYWYPPGAGGMNYQPYIFGGEIINDTTFILKEQYLINASGVKNILNTFNRTYHFKKFGPKPDSTNSFIN